MNFKTLRTKKVKTNTNQSCHGEEYIKGISFCGFFTNLWDLGFVWNGNSPGTFTVEEIMFLPRKGK